MTTATYPETLRTIADAVAAVLPFWQFGKEAPADVTDTLADVVSAVPHEHFARAERENPELELGALRQWVETRVERRDHARFF